MNRRKNRLVKSRDAIIQSVDMLERRSLLTSAIPAIQIGNQAPEYLGELEDRAVLFVEDSGSTTLYLSDGTQDGTASFATVTAVIQTEVTSESVGTNLFFVATGAEGSELWKTDGTTDGTGLVVDLNSGPADSSPTELTSFNDKLYFAATTAEEGRELFLSDGTAEGTTLTASSIDGTEGLGPKELFVYDDVLFYSSTATLGLHRSDSSDIVESNFAAIPEGSRFSDIGSYVIGEVNGRLLVHRTIGGEFTPQRELLSYESASDTNPELLLSLGLGDRTYAGYTRYRNSGERLIFEQTWFFAEKAHKPPWNHLWETDGTLAGTHQIDVYSGRFTPVHEELPGEFRGNTMFTTVDDKWAPNGSPDDFFYSIPANLGSATTATDTYFLDQSEGQSSIRKVKDDNSGLELIHSTTAAISQPVTILGELYFTVHNGNETSLWKIDESAQLPAGPTITSPAIGANIDGFNVAISWDSVAGAVNYDVLVTQTAGGAETAVASAQQVTSISATLGVPPGQSLVSVRARFADGSVTAWSRRFVSSSIAAPTVTSPTGVVSDPDPLIEWTPTDGATNYDIWIAEDGRYKIQGNVTGTSTRTSDLLHNGNTDSYQDGATARIWVRAVFANGTKTSWSVGRDWVKSSDGLHPAIRPYQTSNRDDLNRPEFSWTSSNNVDRYELYINKVGDRSTAVYQRTDLAASRHQLETSLPHGQYEVWVRIIFNDGSRTRWGQTPHVHTIEVARPEITLAEHDPVTNTINLEWDSTDTDVTYEIWVATAANQQVHVINVKDLTTSTYSQTLDISERHRVWVRASHPINGLSAWSSVADIESPEFPRPSEVRITTGEEDTTPGLEWDAIPNAISYELYIQRPYDTPYQRTLPANQHDVEVELRSGYQFKAWVRARFSNSQTTKWSDVTTFVISDVFSETVPEFSVTGNRASWDAVAGANRYELWVNQIDANGRTTVTRIRHETSLSDDGYDLNLATGSYRGWLRAFASSGGVSQWGVLEFTIAAAEPTVPSATPNLDALLTVAVPWPSNTDSHEVDTRSPDNSSPQSFDLTRRDQSNRNVTGSPAADAIELANEADLIFVETMDLLFTDSALTDSILTNS